MNEDGIRILVLAVGYTVAFSIVGECARGKLAIANSCFVGNRYVNEGIVAFCVTGLFSGSTYISILEMSYLKGISAFWYGVAEIVQIFIIAFFIIRAFRKKMLVTVSGLIGDKYG